MYRLLWRSLIRKAPQSVFRFPVILKTNSDSFHKQQEIEFYTN